jgi:hypothetical protein
VHADGDVLTVDVATAGDFSTYRLRLVASASGAAPPPGIDPALAQIDFGFKVRPPDLRDYVLTSVFAEAPLGAIDFR